MRAFKLIVLFVSLVLAITFGMEEDFDNDLAVGVKNFGEILSRKRRGYELSTGLQFLGVGYDILKGSPDGGLSFSGSSSSGHDPGLKPTYRIIRWSEADSKIESGARVPDQVIFSGYRDACIKATSFSMLYGAKSYQKELSKGVDVGANVGAGMFSFGFSVSHGVRSAQKSMNSEKKIFFREAETCLYGSVRWRQSLAETQQHELDPGFILSVCALPLNSASSDRLTLARYISFIRKWGTHVTTKVEFGSKYLKLYEKTVSEMLHMGSSGSNLGIGISGGYGPVSLSVNVDTEKFSKFTKESKKVGRASTEITMGSKDEPEPLKLTLLMMHLLFQRKYWHGEGSKCNGALPDLATLKANMLYALGKYPQWSHVSVLSDLPTTFKITWPKGAYALLKANGECPFSKKRIWFNGNLQLELKGSRAWRYPANKQDKDTGVFAAANHGSSGYMDFYFCKKTMDEVGDIQFDWPRGEYCIISARRRECLNGFSSSALTIRNGGLIGEEYGHTPSLMEKTGSFDIDLCCRFDGYTSDGMLLPTNKPFVLFPTRNTCQEVSGMTAKMYEISPGGTAKVYATAKSGTPKPRVRKNKLKVCFYKGVHKST